jgi:hypothetical protein
MATANVTTEMTKSKISSTYGIAWNYNFYLLMTSSAVTPTDWTK